VDAAREATETTSSRNSPIVSVPAAGHAQMIRHEAPLLYCAALRPPPRVLRRSLNDPARHPSNGSGVFHLVS
jgi:hypothetical protein